MKMKDPWGDVLIGNQTVARPSGCRIETRLDALGSGAEKILHWRTVDSPTKCQSPSAGKSIETSLDAADTSVRATQPAGWPDLGFGASAQRLDTRA
jgi:hypothetical protein